MVDKRKRKLNRRIVLLVFCCWVVVVALLLFHLALERAFVSIGLESSLMIVFKWIFGFAVFFGAGIPFFIWLKAISDWVENMKDQRNKSGD